MKKQMLNGKLSQNGNLSNQGDWASIKPNRSFRSPCFRENYHLDDPILYLKETITPCDDFAKGEYMVTIVCNHNQEQFEIPLRALCLSIEQKEELVINGRVPRNYFSSFNEDCLEGSYLKPDDSSLLHSEEDI